MKFAFAGTLYSNSTTIVSSADSGWLKFPGPIRGNPIYRSMILDLVPADFAGAETIDIDLNLAHDSSGNGDIKVHDFTQIDVNNTAERLILPGGNSVAGSMVAVEASVLEVGTAADQYKPVHVHYPVIQPFFKLTWTVANGPATGASIKVYATMGSD